MHRIVVGDPYPKRAIHTLNNVTHPFACGDDDTGGGGGGRRRGIGGSGEPANSEGRWEEGSSQCSSSGWGRHMVTWERGQSARKQRSKLTLSLAVLTEEWRIGDDTIAGAFELGCKYIHE